MPGNLVAMVMIMSAAVSRCSWWHKHFHWLTTVNRIARRSTKTTACDFFFRKFERPYNALVDFLIWFQIVHSVRRIACDMHLIVSIRLNVCSLKIWCKSYCYLSILNKEKTLTILQKSRMKCDKLNKSDDCSTMK